MASATPQVDSPPPVSALRSRFEQLAQETSPKVASSSQLEVNSYLSPDSHHVRRRTSSNASGCPESPSQSSHNLRPSLSSSDLKGSGRKPPPPPTPSRPQTATTSSHVSTHNGFVVPSSASLSPSHSPRGTISHVKPNPSLRKPPPPPMRIGVGLEPEAPAVAGGVASLRSKFASPGPNTPSTAPKPSGSRIVSHPIQASPPDVDLMSDEPLAVFRTHSHRNSMSSVPSIVTMSPGSINLQTSPLLAASDSNRPTPPPLPHRNSQSRLEIYQQHDVAQSLDDPFSFGLNGREDNNVSHHVNPHTVRRSTIQPPPPPPRPPPRHVGSAPAPQMHGPPSTASSSSEGGSASTTPTLQVPPPLPVRKSPPLRNGDLPGLPPRLPVRPGATLESDPHTGSVSAPPAITERRALGSGAIAPPPTRTIAIGDKLPVARRQASGGSSEDSGDEEDPILKGRPVDLLPDASNSSRRLPIMSALFRQFKAPLPAHGTIAVSGSTVVTVHHEVKIYNLTVSDAPVHYLGAKELASEWRVKEPRVISMEFRCTDNTADRGSLLWLGSKEGHLMEMDVRSAAIVSVRFSAHGHAITNIFRHGRTMITLDESGKGLIFSSEVGGEEVKLASTQPRTIRITERQSFVKMLGGLLWSSGTGSGASGSHSNVTTASGTSRSSSPIIRVYDVLSSTCTSKSLVPLEHVGLVTSGTILPTHPKNVYLGHEGGFVSIWNVQTDTGVPECLEVVKVSVSDILCLEGVNDRLWAGSRKGIIAAYNVEHKPWIVTNQWQAHSELPVQKLMVDPWSIEKCGQLTVVSVGRDEQARFWDGFLGIDWIDKELHQREASFSNFRELKVLIVSWNVDAGKPDTLVGTPENMNFLDSTLKSVNSPDIIVFGFQELIDLENRKMAAKTVLLGGKKKAADGSLSDKVSRSYKMWHDRLVLAVRLAMPVDCPYTVVHAESLVGLFSCVFVKHTERVTLKDAEIKSIKRGMGGRYGNKGGIVARLVIDDSSLCFINCHLAAGQNHVRSRNADVAAILEERAVFPEPPGALDPLAYVGGGDGSMVLDHEIVFLNGDLNYRIDQRREPVIAAIRVGDFNQLLANDQLLKEMRYNRGFRLRSFVEGPITFAPTYKYDRRSSEYDTSEKSRVPAWCDRILWRCREPSRVKLLHYQRYEANISDHRPISGAFAVTIKSVQHDARARAKSELDVMWQEEQRKLLFTAQQFYFSQEII